MADPVFEALGMRQMGCGAGGAPGLDIGLGSSYGMPLPFGCAWPPHAGLLPPPLGPARREGEEILSPANSTSLPSGTSFAGGAATAFPQMPPPLPWGPGMLPSYLESSAFSPLAGVPDMHGIQSSPWGFLSTEQDASKDVWLTSTLSSPLSPISPLTPMSHGAILSLEKENLPNRTAEAMSPYGLKTLPDAGGAAALSAALSSTPTLSDPASLPLYRLGLAQAHSICSTGGKATPCDAAINGVTALATEAPSLMGSTASSRGLRPPPPPGLAHLEGMATKVSASAVVPVSLQLASPRKQETHLCLDPGLGGSGEFSPNQLSLLEVTPAKAERSKAAFATPAPESPQGSKTGRRRRGRRGGGGAGDVAGVMCCDSAEETPVSRRLYSNEVMADETPAKIPVLGQHRRAAAAARDALANAGSPDCVAASPESADDFGQAAARRGTRRGRRAGQAKPASQFQ